MWTLDTVQKVGAVDTAVWHEVLRLMVLARKVDEQIIKLCHQGRIHGSSFTGIGQEAISTAAAIASQPQDLFGPCIRNLALHLGRGETPLGIMRQVLARRDSATGGRDGNIHHGRLENGVYAMISHLGAMISVVAGGVMAKRRQGIDAVGVAFVGDGTTSTGDFHEALNFAAVFDIPILVIIENNHYAYSTPTSGQYRCRRLVDRAAGYGIDGVSADGNNAAEMYVTVNEILTDIRRTPRPVLLEAETMRMRGHGEHDNFKYVPEELLLLYRRRDPINLAVRAMAAAKLMDSEQFAALETSITEEVAAAARQALSEEEPSADTLLQGVYADA
ncbi:MAG: thiamine pyrophosphate-dependent dehydrogenase E1 component subunit alpha [Verrucomicrobia bacterium]|jgi:2-oxoisovalerate dehydrogenase E1 component|nr:thiamine pyrophosphate-dependent dehydrogenase E1 component subunit alpha [Verrucomicrobiota bacterium]MBT7699551.1 thiamine pyrophosphate-dependent dehydrogenase E1 component subunit alpha [Verrucomicrobiota bacterium]